eukprot:COSAG05_NODE_6669_length_923_cov_0.689320_2_plen_80_part_01
MAVEIRAQSGLVEAMQSVAADFETDSEGGHGTGASGSLNTSNNADGTDSLGAALARNRLLRQQQATPLGSGRNSGGAQFS